MLDVGTLGALGAPGMLLGGAAVVWRVVPLELPGPGWAGTAGGAGTDVATGPAGVAAGGAPGPGATGVTWIWPSEN
jgi:hypothetical protein